MPSFEKSPAALTQRFSSMLPRHPDVEPKKMFGYACAFVRGNFWIGSHEGNVVVRLPDGLHARFGALMSSPAFDPMGGRPMKGWFVVPPSVVVDDAAFSRLLADTLSVVLALPAKVSPRSKEAAPKKAAPRKAAPKKAAPKKGGQKKPAPKKGGQKKPAPERAGSQKKASKRR